MAPEPPSRSSSSSTSRPAVFPEAKARAKARAAVVATRSTTAATAATTVAVAEAQKVPDVVSVRRKLIPSARAVPVHLDGHNTSNSNSSRGRGSNSGSKMAHQQNGPGGSGAGTGGRPSPHRRGASGGSGKSGGGPKPFNGGSSPNSNSNKGQPRGSPRHPHHPHHRSAQSLDNANTTNNSSGRPRLDQARRPNSSQGIPGGGGGIGPDPAMLHASETSLYQSRIRDGLCPTCGIRLFELKKPGLLSKRSSMKRIPLNVDGAVFGGQCLRCNRPGGPAGAGQQQHASASSFNGGGGGGGGGGSGNRVGSGRDFNNSLNLGSLNLGSSGRSGSRVVMSHMQPDMVMPPGHARHPSHNASETSFDGHGSSRGSLGVSGMHLQQRHSSQQQQRMSTLSGNTQPVSQRSSMVVGGGGSSQQLHLSRGSVQQSQQQSHRSSMPTIQQQRPSLADASGGGGKAGAGGESNRSVSQRSLDLLSGTAPSEGISAIPQQGRDFSTDDKKRQLLIEQEILMKQFESSRVGQMTADMPQPTPPPPPPSSSSLPNNSSPPPHHHHHHAAADAVSPAHKSLESLDKGVGTHVTTPHSPGSAGPGPGPGPGGLGGQQRQSSSRRGNGGRSASQPMPSVDERHRGRRKSEDADPVDEVDDLAIKAINPDDHMVREQLRIMEEIKRQNESREKKVTDKALHMSGEVAYTDKFNEDEKGSGKGPPGKRRSAEHTTRTATSTDPISLPSRPSQDETDFDVDIDLLDANTTSDNIAAFAAKPKGGKRTMESWSKEWIGTDGKDKAGKGGDREKHGEGAAAAAHRGNKGAADRRRRRHEEQVRQANGDIPTNIQLGDHDSGSDISEGDTHARSRGMKQIEAIEKRMILERMRKQEESGEAGVDGEERHRGKGRRSRSREQSREAMTDVMPAIMDEDAIREQEAIMRDIDRKRREKEKGDEGRHRHSHGDKRHPRKKSGSGEEKDRPPVPMTIAVPPGAPEDENGNNFDEDLRDGCTYIGDHNSDGLRHGRGTLEWGNGDKYEGQFSNGMRHGVGKLCFADGSEYDGWWRNNRMDGHGTRRFPNGNVYVGTYADGRRNGQGRHVFANGDQYVGTFKDDAMHGTGRYYFKNNESFEGTFNRGRKEGKGKYQWSDGTVDIIRYSNDVRVGEGIRYSADRKKAWKLEASKVKGKISLDRAQKLIERFDDDVPKSQS